MRHPLFTENNLKLLFQWTLVSRALLLGERTNSLELTTRSWAYGAPTYCYSYSLCGWSWASPLHGWWVIPCCQWAGKTGLHNEAIPWVCQEATGEGQAVEQDRCVCVCMHYVCVCVCVFVCVCLCACLRSHVVSIIQHHYCLSDRSGQRWTAHSVELSLWAEHFSHLDSPDLPAAPPTKSAKRKETPW